MELHIKVVGSLLIGLSLLHIILPKYFKWQQELAPLTLLTRQIFYVHTFFIAFVVMLMGLLCVLYSKELSLDPFGRVISLGLFAFWFTRLIFQIFVYTPKAWRGKRFETSVHVLFTLMWLYFSAVFLFASFGSQTIVIHGEAQFYRGHDSYTVPYDSTQGVPSYVFMGFWVIIILFGIRIAWEFRDEIFKKK